MVNQIDPVREMHEQQMAGILFIGEVVDVYSGYRVISISLQM